MNFNVRMAICYIRFMEIMWYNVTRKLGFYAGEIDFFTK